MIINLNLIILSHNNLYLIFFVKRWPQIINLKAVFQQKKGKFVCKITSHENEEDEKITINRIFLVLSEDNDFHTLKIYPEGMHFIVFFFYN